VLVQRFERASSERKGIAAELPESPGPCGLGHGALLPAIVGVNLKLVGQQIC